MWASKFASTGRIASFLKHSSLKHLSATSLPLTPIWRGTASSSFHPPPTLPFAFCPLVASCLIPVQAFIREGKVVFATCLCCTQSNEPRTFMWSPTWYSDLRWDYKEDFPFFTLDNQVENTQFQANKGYWETYFRVCPKHLIWQATFCIWSLPSLFPHFQTKVLHIKNILLKQKSKCSLQTMGKYLMPTSLFLPWTKLKPYLMLRSK